MGNTVRLLNYVQQTKDFMATPEGKSLYDQAMGMYGLPTRATALCVMKATGIGKGEDIDIVTREVMK